MLIRPNRFLPLLLAGAAWATGLPAPAASPDAGTAQPAVAPADAMAGGVAEEPLAKATRLFWESIRLLNTGSAKDRASGRAMMLESAGLGFAHAQFELGRYYFAGMHGFRLNEERGAREFIRAAEQGLSYGMVAAGQCYFYGSGVKADDRQAERWLKASLADNADVSPPAPPDDLQGIFQEVSVAGALWTDPAVSSKAAAQYLLGKLAEKRKKAAAAHEFFLAAAYAGIDGRDGNLEAAKEAAVDFAHGRGVARDMAKARELIAHSRTLSKRLAISRVQAMAQAKEIDDFATADMEEEIARGGDMLIDLMENTIADTLSNRKQKEYDPREAAKWFEVIAEKGNTWAMVSLALLHGGKELGKPDPVAAFQWWKRAAGDNPLNSPFAAANLAVCHQNGVGTPRDPAAASAIFEKLKDFDVICYLGSIGQAPKAPMTFEAEMKLLETWAKRKKDRHAQFLMGRRYLGEYDGVTNAPLAVEWLTKAGRARHPGALFMLGKIGEPGTSPLGIAWIVDSKAPAKYFMEATELGSADAALAMGFNLQTGKGVERSVKLAEQYYRRALELRPGDAAVHNNLGVLFEERLREAKAAGTTDSEGLLEAMLREYEEAERLGFPTVLENLGKIYLTDEFLPADHEKAYSYFTRAVSQGVVNAHYHLGFMHENGKGVPVTYTEAAYHYRFAALEKNHLAAERLVDFYLTGKGVSRDLARAESWLRHMVDSGYQHALPQLAEVLIERENHEEAFQIYQKLAAMKDRALIGCGYWGMSTCYSKGIGVLPDKLLSEGYLELAVQFDNPEALAELANAYFAKEQTKEGVETMSRAAASSASASYALGQMYYFGTNVEQDRAKSISLMRDSARMRNPKAMFFLAAATFNRDPAAPDLNEAIQFAAMAENMGLPEAPALREKLERRRDRTDGDSEQIARPRAG